MRQRKVAKKIAKEAVLTEKVKKSNSKSMMHLSAFIGISFGVLMLLLMLKNDSSSSTVQLTSPLQHLSNAHNKSLLWGTYRPGLYLGLRSRTSPFHVSAGLLWTSSANPTAVRHQCQEQDRLSKYGWLQHSGRGFGKQVIDDPVHQASLQTTFVASNESWLVTVKTTQEHNHHPIDLFFYIDLGCAGDEPDHKCRSDLQSINVRKSEEENVVSAVVSDNGVSDNLLSPFTVDFKCENCDLSFHTHPKMNLLNVENMVKSIVLKKGSSTSSGASTMVIVHAKNVYPRDSSFTIALSRNPKTNLEKLEKEESEAFIQKFENVYGLSKKTVDSVAFNSSQIEFAQAALSNLVGGIGYFSESRDDVLYSAVPSRSFFPRGFLWDEGFHQLLVVNWDVEITKDVVGHWFNRMIQGSGNNTGWIPREQILGAEAKARVPSEFLAQHPLHANPPTLILVVEKLLDSSVDDVFFKAIYPKLLTWYNWFKRTQAGNLAHTFRWRGRSANDGKLIANTLSSGLDDYPRASKPTSSEVHVDLLCWMITFANVLTKVSKHVEKHHASTEFTKDATEWKAALEKHHWDETQKSYFDIGVHSADGEIQSQIVIKCKSTTTGDTIDATAPIEMLQQGSRVNPCPRKFPQFLYPLGDGAGGLLTKPTYVPRTTKYQFVNHVGYVSCFPFLLKVLDANSTRLKSILDQVTSPKHLWSSYGIRSLSPQDPMYEVENAAGDRPYWRGALWMNLNYMAVSAFHHYANVPGPYQEQCRQKYKELRSNVINNIYNEYVRTGYLWEQYNGNVNSPAQGNGQRSHPFTGWTALVVNMMAEKY